MNGAYWQKPEWSNATLNGADTPHPSFVADVHGKYVLQLIVRDGFGGSSLATVIADFDNISPVAEAGPDQYVQARGTQIQLDGAGSYDENGDTLTYEWRFITKPINSVANLDYPTSPKPTFVADVHGDYVAELTVGDGFGALGTDTVRVGFDNLKPIADAGPAVSVPIGQMVALDGSKSFDANLDPLNFSWSIVAAPRYSDAVIINPGEMTAQFIPDRIGTFVLQLIVNDGFVDSASDTKEVEVIASNDSATGACQELQTLVEKVPNSAFSNPQHKKNITKKLNDIIRAIGDCNYPSALDKTLSLVGKTDGCYESMNPDTNDWITNCPSQTEVFLGLLDIIDQITFLQNNNICRQ